MFQENQQSPNVELSKGYDLQSKSQLSPISKLFGLGCPLISPTKSNNTNGVNAKSQKSSSTKNPLLKNGTGLRIEQINTGGCGVDPAIYNKGRKCKRSQSLIRRSSKKLHKQVQPISNSNDCNIS